MKFSLHDLKIPILQAPIAGADTVELVVETSSAGAMGSMGMTWTDPKAAVDIVHQIKSKTKDPFFINFVVSESINAFEAVIDAGVPAVTLSWGQNKDLIEIAHHSGAAVGVQVGSPEGANMAIENGADFVICQGSEAGGHVQSSTPLGELLPVVIETSKDIPVVATGGLADADDIRWALDEGATAVMLGTRFVATVESQAHEKYKEAIVKANAEDSCYTQCFELGWPHAAHRALRNKTLKIWEAGGCPPPGVRPGEGEIIAYDGSGEGIVRYSFENPRKNYTGNVLDCCLYAGTSVGKIVDIPTANELLLRLYTGLNE